MFKTGQVIRSTRTNRIFIVEAWPFARPIVDNNIWPNPLKMAHDQLVLIGNNYQAKPKCSR
jgi:hypothetical protein